jgi:hypothetical protein
MNTLLRANLFLLFLVAVFDPADRVTHLKVPLFVSLWVIFVLDWLISKQSMAPVAGSMLIYILMFAVVLPLTSILLYFLRGGPSAPYDGFQYLKSYLFLTLAAILVTKRIDAVRSLSIVLTILSVAILAMEVFTYNDQGLTQFLWVVGDSSGIFAIGTRTYADLSYSYAYFHAAPLLVLSLAYFSYRTITSELTARYLNLALLVLNLAAMLCSGTRNDIIFGLLTPLLVFIWYSSKTHRFAIFALLLVGAAILGTYGTDIVQAMFDPGNESNAIKLAHVKDYSVLFSNPKILFFGQGLGSYFYSSGFGTETSITELTYLEFIRSFGLILATVYYGLLLYPIAKLRDEKFRNSHYLVVAYSAYLIICVANPLLVSSTGMLLLSIVAARAFSPGETSWNLMTSETRVQQTPA